MVRSRTQARSPRRPRIIDGERTDEGWMSLWVARGPRDTESVALFVEKPRLLKLPGRREWHNDRWDKRRGIIRLSLLRRFGITVAPWTCKRITLEIGPLALPR